MCMLNVLYTLCLKFYLDTKTDNSLREKRTFVLDFLEHSQVYGFIS